MNTPPKLSFACPLPWASMSGDERSKFCSKCAHQIPNLSLLSFSERQALLEKAKSQQICGTYYVRLTGELVTPSSPLSQRESKNIRQYGVAALSAAALLVASRCVTHPQQAEEKDNLSQQVPVTEDAGKSASSKPEAQSDDEVVLLTGFIVCAPEASMKMHGPHAQ